MNSEQFPRKHQDERVKVSDFYKLHPKQARRIRSTAKRALTDYNKNNSSDPRQIQEVKIVIEERRIVPGISFFKHVYLVVGNFSYHLRLDLKNSDGERLIVELTENESLKENSTVISYGKESIPLASEVVEHLLISSRSVEFLVSNVTLFLSSPWLSALSYLRGRDISSDPS
jgi:hypothetical protein